MKVPVVNVKGETVGDQEISDELYGITVKPSVLHQAVVWQNSRRRAGTASTKGRSEVSGGGKKPWKQKGTGRARAGSTRSPLWRHGGVTHGPKPKDWALSFPKRMRKLAVRMALANRAQLEVLAILDSAAGADPRTKSAISMLSTLGQERVLFVTKNDESKDALAKSLKNVPNSKVLPECGLNVYDILNHTYVVVESGALGTIEARIQAGR